MLEETLVIFKNIRTPGYKGTLENYKARGGYQALEKALQMPPGEVVNIVKASGLRGRGGAGFPTGLKWSFMAKGTGKPSYLVINADEGEPGTFKDRDILLHEPHVFLEGYMIGCYALGCHDGFIYTRGEFVPAMKSLQKAIDECYDAGIIGEKLMGTDFRLDLTNHPGAGAYICGEETALLDSLEGKRGQPRSKPPFPAVAGFNGCPTSVNNVETLASVPYILREGADAFKDLGTPNNAGTHLVSLSGQVNNPGVYEVKMGVSLKDIIYELGGGIRGGKELKGVIPGGSSTPVLLPEEIDVPYDYDSMAKAGTMMGSGAVIAFDEDTDVVKMLYRLVQFYNHESCGQCTPCREGCNWSRLILRDFINQQGTPEKMNRLKRVSGNIMGSTLCALGDACAMPIQTFLKKYPDEFHEHFAQAS